MQGFLTYVEFIRGPDRGLVGMLLFSLGGLMSGSGVACPGVFGWHLRYPTQANVLFHPKA